MHTNNSYKCSHTQDLAMLELSFNKPGPVAGLLNI
jgi:hypothetical protein